MHASDGRMHFNFWNVKTHLGIDEYNFAKKQWLEFIYGFWKNGM